eukprot:scaffold180_cov134-Isochrysis_galbana.AAC.10
MVCNNLLVWPHQADAVCRCRLAQAGCSRLQLRIALATEAAGLRALARRGCKAPEAIRMLW